MRNVTELFWAANTQPCDMKSPFPVCSDISEHIPIQTTGTVWFVMENWNSFGSTPPWNAKWACARRQKNSPALGGLINGLINSFALPSSPCPQCCDTRTCISLCTRWRSGCGVGASTPHPGSPGVRGQWSGGLVGEQLHQKQSRG